MFDTLMDLVSGFSKRQGDLVHEAGFGTFFDHPIHVRFNKQFNIWLMGRVDTVLHTIEFNGCKVNFFR